MRQNELENEDRDLSWRKQDVQDEAGALGVFPGDGTIAATA